MDKHSGLCREIKNIKKISGKSSRKDDYSSSNISRSDFDSSLSSDSEWDKKIQPAERKYMNKLDYVVTNNIKNKDQSNDAIEYDPKVDDIFV